METDEEFENTNNLVKFLREKMEYVHTFAILIKKSDLVRKTRDLVSIIKTFEQIFGPGFLKNVVLVVTFWDYDTDVSKEKLKSNMKSLFTSGTKDIDSIPAVYYGWSYNDEEKEQFEIEMNNLLNYSNQNKPFHCANIEVVLNDYISLQQKLENKEKELINLNETATKVKILESELRIKNLTIKNLNTSLHSSKQTQNQPRFVQDKIFESVKQSLMPLFCFAASRVLKTPLCLELVLLASSSALYLESWASASIIAIARRTRMMRTFPPQFPNDSSFIYKHCTK